ncbi:hypothetical protein HDU82_006461 [Entophlyctis luteolus]|nr:hypothetical protein HDU82_006461 [Entophlyctis luteolus]KAJ3387271.1 hypothetical protein HDU84_000920 [Entophlyctis sp. JEL0112]
MFKFIAALAAAAQLAAATTYSIGTQGLSFTGAPSTANIGDVLSFSITGHAVVDVSADVYNSCGVTTSTSPVIGITSNGGGSIAPFTITKAGTYYVVCPIGDGAHCQAGMKFSFTVADAAPTTAAATTQADAAVTAATSVASAATSGAASTIAATAAAGTTTTTTTTTSKNSALGLAAGYFVFGVVGIFL